MEVDSKTKNSVEDRTRTSKHSTIMKNDDGAVWLRGKADKYRNNASKRPPGRCDSARVKRHPGAFTTWPGRFLGKKKRAFCLPRAIEPPPNQIHASYTATALQQQQV